MSHLVSFPDNMTPFNGNSIIIDIMNLTNKGIAVIRVAARLQELDRIKGIRLNSDLFFGTFIFCLIINFHTFHEKNDHFFKRTTKNSNFKLGYQIESF